MNFRMAIPRACNKKCEKQLEDSIKNNTVYEGAGSPFSILKENFDKAGIEAVCKLVTELFSLQVEKVILRCCIIFLHIRNINVIRG